MYYCAIGCNLCLTFMPEVTYANVISTLDMNIGYRHSFIIAIIASLHVYCIKVM